MDDTPRQAIPIVLYVRLCFSLTELFWLSLGVKWIFIDGDSCETSPGWKISKGVLIFNWMFLIFVALLGQSIVILRNEAFFFSLCNHNLNIFCWSFSEIKRQPFFCETCFVD